MKTFKGDLHIHSCLSPCGSLDNSPSNIIATAKRKGLEMIAVTDHNTTRNVKTCIELGKEAELFVLPGCEVTTLEEVHCLAYFADTETMDVFQEYLDRYLPDIKNNPAFFGYQVAVNRHDEIIYEEEKLLVAAIEQDLESVAEMVHALGGLFVPAHIDRPKNSVFSQLGFIPTELKYDALEISKRTPVAAFKQSHPQLNNKVCVQNSDAHYLDDIATAHCVYEMETLNWEQIRATFAQGLSRISLAQ